MAERTVYRLLQEAAAQWGNAPALYEPAGSKTEPEWKPWSWVQYRDAVTEIAAGLVRLGVSAGDVVALDSETRLEFYLTDMAVLAVGGISAALYTSYPPADHVKTLRLLEPKVVFVENDKVLAGLLSAADPAIQTRWIVLDGDASALEDAMTLQQLREAGREGLADDPQLVENLSSRVRASDPAILYLTSGATGEPKMGLVTHAAVVANVDIGANAVPIGPEDSSVAFLPSAHITQRVAMQIFPIRMGMPVYFSRGLSSLPRELKAIRPTFLVAPPRVWERMYASICAEIHKRGPLTRRIFYGAVGLGSEAARRKQEGRSVPGWMRGVLSGADKAVFAQIRDRMGGRLRMAISGAAPLGKDMAEFFAAIGLPIHEGYGLTEGGIVALNPYGRAKSGSIGKPLDRVEVKIAEDGEILFRSPTMFSGYYRAPEATAAVMRDGWLRTGDVGEFDAEGYLYITGRKKEVLVASNGKKIYPALIEGVFKMEPLINQVLLLGDKQSYVAALFTLNHAAAETLKGMEGYRGCSPAELVKAPPVVEEMKRLVKRINRQLAPFEQIRRYHVLERDFAIETGELTPTMKVRRTRVIENHREIISQLFLGRDGSEE